MPNGRQPRMPTSAMTADRIAAEMRALAHPDKAAQLGRFFKTGPGEYAEGDRFLGLTVPQTRRIVRAHRDLALAEVGRLLHSPFHEERLAAVLLLVDRFERADEAGRQEVFDFYLGHTAFVNNWDLVDVSAPNIVGARLLTRDRAMLRTLAGSESLWERRIAIIATFAFIRAGQADDTFAIARRLLDDRHDLIHKAIGWMLREVGKRVGEDALRGFLRENLRGLPRTALRYAIERFPAEERRAWLEA